MPYMQNWSIAYNDQTFKHRTCAAQLRTQCHCVYNCHVRYATKLIQRFLQKRIQTGCLMIFMSLITLNPTHLLWCFKFKQGGLPCFRYTRGNSAIIANMGVHYLESLHPRVVYRATFTCASFGDWKLVDKSQKIDITERNPCIDMCESKT